MRTEKMNRKFELHVISQIYDFLVEREAFTSLNLDRKVTEFFREVHVGREEDFTKRWSHLFEQLKAYL